MLNVVLFLLSQLHFVSYNTKYADIFDALKHGDGLAVLGIVIQVTTIKINLVFRKQFKRTKRFAVPDD